MAFSMKLTPKIESILWGAAGGAAALALVGFAFGGWVTGGKAAEMARQQTDKAVVAALAPICVDEFLHPLADGVVLFVRYRVRALVPALEKAQPLVRIVVRARLFALDVHAVVFRGGGVARIERGKRAVVVLHHEARDVRVVAGQHELGKPAVHGLDRTHQVFEHVGVMDADLQHDAPRHAFSRVTP